MFEGSVGVFVLLTIMLGGGAAFLAGRTLAKEWRPIGLVLFYMIPLGAGVRFLHFALYEHDLFSGAHFVAHTLILMAFALFGYRLKRVDQMIKQYPWLYERSGPLAWRSKT
jgi:hypothetical protein